MPRPPGLPKTGGRQAGTPNKATRQVKEFLERVFTRAFRETYTVTRGRRKVRVSLEDRLVDEILTGTIDDATLRFLFSMYAGSPARQVTHQHSGTVNLARIIAGDVDSADDEEDGDA